MKNTKASKPKSFGIEAKIKQTLKKKEDLSLSKEELASQMGVQQGQKENFLKALEGLLLRRKVIEIGGKLLFAEGLISAQVVKVNPTFGFVKPQDSEKDVFIPGHKLLGAVPGDEVLIKQLQTEGQLPEGEVIKIVSQKAQKFSGVLTIDEKSASIFPDSYMNFPIKVDMRKLAGAKSGEKVVAVIEKRGKRHSEHLARVIETLGGADSAASCCKAILLANDISEIFPDEVIEQAQAITVGVSIHPKELMVRKDLRDALIFTIDGAESKDLDDALSIEKTKTGWQLGVHIADVSYYITHQSPLDLEAFERGTSVYYANKVIPMLPEEISNGICSLNPGEDRLAFSAIINISQGGKIESYDFVKTVINSKIKGIYSEVNLLLEGQADDAITEKYKDVSQSLVMMKELADILKKNRNKRGGVNLSSIESKIVLSEDDKVIEISKRQGGLSEEIIEEFMLTANEAAATFAIAKGLPFVFRVHDQPAKDRLQKLYDTLDQMGIPFSRGKDTELSLNLSAVLQKVEGEKTQGVVNNLVLRTMAKAKYLDKNTGHFGLGLENYAHFTAPIRRYSDLVIHRIMTGFVIGMKMENIHKRFDAFAATSAARVSGQEIVAMTTERSCVDCYKAQYMRDFVGEEFDGVITGATSYGIFVQLENTVEGMISLASMPSGDWRYDGVISIVSALSGKKMRLGDTLTIKVLSADVSAGKVEFGFVASK